MSANQVSQEQLSAWVKEQFQRANKHLAEQGLLFESVVTEESRYLAPIVAVWKIKTSDGKFYWVISGDLPADFMPYETEKTAREAIRSFSFRWQMQAENILRSDSPDQTENEFSQLLIAKAETLYAVFNDDKAWGGPVTA